MTTKTKRKTFDCVEMKNRIQAKILAEYEARKDEFLSYEAFTAARLRRSPWARRIWAKFARQIRNPPV